MHVVIEIEASGLVKLKKVDVVSPDQVLAEARASIFPTESYASAKTMDTKPIAAARPEHPMYTTR